MIDKRYLKISLYGVFTLIVFYVLKKGVDIAVLLIANFDDIFACLARVTGKAFSVFSLPVFGFVTAYLLDPLCDFFQNAYDKRFKRKSSRRVQGVAAVYIILIGFLFGMGFFAARSIDGAVSLDSLISDSVLQLNVMYGNVVDFLEKKGLYSVFEGYVDRAWAGLWESVNRFGELAIKRAAGLGGFMVNLLLGFVIAFYFLLDKEKFLKGGKALFKRLLPQKIYLLVRKAALDAHSVFSGYIRGQLTDAFIMSLLIASLLTILRVRFAVVIGIISGFSNIIPYFGALVGFALAVLSALLSGEALKAVYAAIAVIILQQLDSAVIAPKIVGEKVELSPPAVIIALAVGGKLFGLWGMIFAVPAVGIFKNIILSSLCRPQ